MFSCSSLFLDLLFVFRPYYLFILGVHAVKNAIDVGNDCCYCFFLRKLWRQEIVGRFERGVRAKAGAWQQIIKKITKKKQKNKTVFRLHIHSFFFLNLLDLSLRLLLIPILGQTQQLISHITELFSINLSRIIRVGDLDGSLHHHRVRLLFA